MPIAQKSYQLPSSNSYGFAKRSSRKTALETMYEELEIGYALLDLGYHALNVSCFFYDERGVLRNASKQEFDEAVCFLRECKKRLYEMVGMRTDAQRSLAIVKEKERGIMRRCRLTRMSAGGLKKRERELLQGVTSLEILEIRLSQLRNKLTSTKISIYEEEKTVREINFLEERGRIYITGFLEATTKEMMENGLLEEKEILEYSVEELESIVGECEEIVSMRQGLVSVLSKRRESEKRRIIEEKERIRELHMQIEEEIRGRRSHRRNKKNRWYEGKSIREGEALPSNAVRGKVQFR